MARIRSVHPSLLTDEAFMGLTVNCMAAIPLLLGLWMEADDSGAFEWKPLTIKARVLPAAVCDIAALLGVLEETGFIRRFEIEGRSLGVIRNFVKFQRPKSPVDVHPFSTESRAYAGFDKEGKRPHAGTGRPPSVPISELLPNSTGTPSELSRQMKEEGGRMKKEVSSLRSDVARRAFAEFRSAYPKREGSQPWTPAEKKFLALVKGGEPPEKIIEGAKAYARSMAGKEPRFVAQAITWLNQSRWRDEFESPASAPPPRHGRTTNMGGGVDFASDESLKPFLERFFKDGSWPYATAPPGEPGCRVPDDLLPPEYRSRQTA